jgi:hypothetical protein
MVDLLINGIRPHPNATHFDYAAIAHVPEARTGRRFLHAGQVDKLRTGKPPGSLCDQQKKAVRLWTCPCHCTPGCRLGCLRATLAGFGRRGPVEQRQLTAHHTLPISTRAARHTQARARKGRSMGSERTGRLLHDRAGHADQQVAERFGGVEAKAIRYSVVAHRSGSAICQTSL